MLEDYRHIILEDGKKPCERNALAPRASTRGSDLSLSQTKSWLIDRRLLLSGPSQIASALKAEVSNSKSVINPRRIGSGAQSPLLLSCRKNGAAAQRLTGGPGQPKSAATLPHPPSPISISSPAVQGVSSQADTQVGPRIARPRPTSNRPGSSIKQSSLTG